MSYFTGAVKTLVALAFLILVLAQVGVPLVEALKALRKGGIEEFHFTYTYKLTQDHKYVVLNITLHYNGTLRFNCIRVYSPELGLNASFGAIPGPGSYYTITEVPATIDNALRLIHKNFTVIVYGVILNGYITFNATVPPEVVRHG